MILGNAGLRSRIATGAKEFPWVLVFWTLGSGCGPDSPLGGTPQSPKHSVAFGGALNEGRAFTREFDERFTFELKPVSDGWLVGVRDRRSGEDLTRLTTPWHFVPNPRELYGWHFRNSDNSGPNEPGPKNVNAPQKTREFIYSPEVGRTIRGPESRRQPTYEEVQRIGEFGRGKLTILDYRLRNLVAGERAGFEWLRFRVELMWGD